MKQRKAQFVVGEVILGVAIIIGAALGTYAVLKDITTVSYVGDPDQKLAYVIKDSSCEPIINAIPPESAVAFNTLVQVKSNNYQVGAC